MHQGLAGTPAFAGVTFARQHAGTSLQARFLRRLHLSIRYVTYLLLTLSLYMTGIELPLPRSKTVD